MVTIPSQNTSGWLFIEPQLRALLLWRKEAQESWEHVVSNQLVAVVNGFQPNIASSGGYITPEEYLMGDFWFEAYLVMERQGHLHFYGAIIEKSVRDVGVRRNREAHAKGDRWNYSVLVGIPEAVQNPEEMVFSFIPHVVRLHLLDDDSSFVGDVLERITNPSQRLPGVVFVNGKASAVVWTFLGQKRKLPNEVIQSRAEIMNNFTKKDSEFDGRSQERLEPEDIEALLRIKVFNDRVIVTPKVLSDSSVKFLQVVFRPVNLAPHPIQLMIRADLWVDHVPDSMPSPASQSRLDNNAP